MWLGMRVLWLVTNISGREVSGDVSGENLGANINDAGL
jgi:hypothetical protein